MKLLIINGTPHRGNTWKLVELVRERMTELDEDIEYDEVHLIDEALPMCEGCSACFRKGHLFCPHAGVIQPIMEKIEASDGVIFATACYQMNVTALTKNFTDHLAFLLHRPRYYNKKALVVATTGGVGVRNAAKFLAGAVKGWGFNRCEKLAVRALSWNDYQPTARQRKKARRMAGDFYLEAASHILHRPSLSVLIPYNLFRGMRFRVGPDSAYPTEDGVYWTKTGQEKAVYFPQVPVGLIKRAAGSLFYLFGRIGARFFEVTYKK